MILQNILQYRDGNPPMEIVIAVSKKWKDHRWIGSVLGTIAVDDLVESTKLSQPLGSDESINVLDPAVKVFHARRRVWTLQFDRQPPIRTPVVSQFESILVDSFQVKQEMLDVRKVEIAHFRRNGHGQSAEELGHLNAKLLVNPRYWLSASQLGLVCVACVGR